MSNSKARSARVKPRKPSDDFPLFAHACGQWAKKCKGKMHYFGAWDDPWGALANWKRQEPYLTNGRRPPAEVRDEDDGEVLTVGLVCNHFLTKFKKEVEMGNKAEISFRTYSSSARVLIESLGRHTPMDSLTIHDMEKLRADVAKGRKKISQVQLISHLRTILRHSWNIRDQNGNRLLRRKIDLEGLESPNPKAIAAEQFERPKKTFEREEILKMLDHADSLMRALILLSINCALGPSDLSKLRINHLDLDKGLLHNLRSKTSVERRSKLWPETIAAIKKVLETRPEPAQGVDSQYVFLNDKGRPFTGATNTGGPIEWRIRRFLARIGIKKVEGRNAYGFRHSHRTISDRSLDTPACDLIMGHRTPGMGTNYRAKIDDERLVRVSDVVRQWLFQSDEPDIIPLHRETAT